MFTIAIMITVDYHDNRLITTIAQLYSVLMCVRSYRAEVIKCSYIAMHFHTFKISWLCCHGTNFKPIATGGPFA